ncbi:TFPI [Mytilus edulis]|uniref:TFPI n=1 Tax=Mytilus edulis TaxID=6550 RepID=A0A8S3V3I8_MYTED|nr:TFPI [Mytilus edulis]
MKFATAFRFLILMVYVEESLSSDYKHSDHVNSCECGLEKDEGYCCNKHCYPKGNYFYYDTKSGKCRSLAYQGCGGNANKFHSKKECRQACRKGYGNKCEVCPPSTYVYASYCGCYEKSYCNCKPGYYCCPVTCGLPDKTPHKGYSCKKPIQVKCARGHRQRTSGGGRKRKDNVRKNTKRHDNNGKGNVRKNTKRHDINGKGNVRKKTKRHDNNGKGKVRKNTKRHDNNGKGNVRKKTKRHDNNGKGNVRKKTKRHDNNGKGKVRKNTKRHDNNGKGNVRKKTTRHDNNGKGNVRKKDKKAR